MACQEPKYACHDNIAAPQLSIYTIGLLGCLCLVLVSLPLSSLADATNSGSVALKVGDVVPDFTLKDSDGKTAVKLSSLKGEPVVLIFGSCTCPYFVESTPLTERLFVDCKEKVHFYVIYTRETHPIYEQASPAPGRRFQVTAPKLFEARQLIAKDYVREVWMPMPVLVDSIEDGVSKAYSSCPNRMYIVNAKGMITDSGLAAPRGVIVSAQRAAELLDGLLLSGN